MKTHLILFKHTGECAVTPKTVHSLWRGQVDLSERKSCIWSNDDWRQVSEPMWAVAEVELPDWMDPERYCDSGWTQIAWKYFEGLGGDETFGKEWFFQLAKLDDTTELACIQLLKTKKFRSEFREKLRDHLVAWLGTDPEQRQYDKPFSPKQLACLVNSHQARDAQRISNRLYTDRDHKVVRWLTTEEAMDAVLQLDKEAKRRRFELWRKSLERMFRSAGIVAHCSINDSDDEVWSIEVEIEGDEEGGSHPIFCEGHPRFTVDVGFRSVEFDNLRDAAKHIALETIGDDLSPVPLYDKRQIPLHLP